MGRMKIQWKPSDTFTLEEFATLAPQSQRKVLRTMSPEHRKALMDECLVRIESSNEAACSPGRFCNDGKGITRFPEPYTMMKKYSHLYTCLAGWQFDEDLKQREQEMLEKDEPTEEALQALVEKFNGGRCGR